MNLVFDQYSDNPIVAAMVSWPPHPHGIEEIRACCPLLRQPFIEITYLDGQSSQYAFGKQGFLRFWQEAEVLIESLTNIRILREFAVAPMTDHDRFSREVDDCLKESIEESNAIFEGGMYQLFLDQYGANCKDLPSDVSAKIREAESKVAGQAQI